ncbi:MAG: hypothetical protein KDC98_20860 [Planctomycetes bacterium]|nr:hypothetical protein [Planctomycetota bacterium]
MVDPEHDGAVEPVEEVPKVRRGPLRLTIVAVLLVWTMLYNWLIKGQGPLQAFFSILDTISDDFVMGTTVTVGVGVGIVIVFSATKLYTQIIANVHSFRILEDLFHDDLRRHGWRVLLKKLFSFQDLPLPDSSCPRRVSSILLAFSFTYAMSWVYVILFSEALFFVSWSAGVNLRISHDSPELMLIGLPTLALAIPFSARVMAYVRYPYAQDYADFMPGAVFVLLLVGALGGLFNSPDQKFFLEQVFLDAEHPGYPLTFIANGVFLAFIPVFFEGAFWLWELSRKEQSVDDKSAGEAVPGGSDAATSAPPE